MVALQKPVIIAIGVGVAALAVTITAVYWYKVSKTSEESKGSEQPVNTAISATSNEQLSGKRRRKVCFELKNFTSFQCRSRKSNSQQGSAVGTVSSTTTAVANDGAVSDGSTGTSGTGSSFATDSQPSTPAQTSTPVAAPPSTYLVSFIGEVINLVSGSQHVVQLIVCVCLRE